MIHTSAETFKKDTILTSEGNLLITFVGHGTLIFEYKGMVYHIDPVMEEADYSKMPKADAILVTHHHGDHFDRNAINRILKENTTVVLTKKCSENAKGLSHITILENGNKTTVNDILIEAVPAYNIKHMRSPGTPFHPKGEGNGYIISFGDKKVYVAGDTENTPEMKSLTGIDIAFLPMNLPYTMTPEMVADAALAFKPNILYPYHFGNTDTGKLFSLLGSHPEIEVRIRDMK